MRPAPKLNDPEERAAYRRELRGVVPGVRMAGTLLAVLGAAALAGWKYEAGVPLWAATALLGAAAALMISGIVTRTRYHKARMRGEG